MAVFPDSFLVAVTLDLDAHRPRGAGDGAHRGVDVRGVEVGHLRRRDVAELLGRDLSDLDLVRLLRPRPRLLRRGQPGRLLDQDRRGRRLGDEGERPIRVDGDLDRDRDVVLRLRLRARVELLAELHDVDAVLTQRRPDGGRRVGLTGGNLELDETRYLLHDFSTWEKSSSTGVARPKIETLT